MKKTKLRTFYHPKMAVNPENITGYANSPAKPRLLMEYLEKKELMEFFLVDDSFPLLTRDDFYIAHTILYIVSLCLLFEVLFYLHSPHYA